MSTSTSSRATNGTARSTSRKIPPAAVGAVLGAAVGGVVGAMLVKRARSPKRLLPAKMPALGRKALEAVKDVANDAMVVAKITAARAADQAIAEMKTAARDFVVDVASGHPSSTPKPAALALPATSERATPPHSKSASGAKKPARTKSTGKSRGRASGR